MRYCGRMDIEQLRQHARRTAQRYVQTEMAAVIACSDVLGVPVAAVAQIIAPPRWVYLRAARAQLQYVLHEIPDAAQKLDSPTVQQRMATAQQRWWNQWTAAVKDETAALRQKAL